MRNAFTGFRFQFPVYPAGRLFRTETAGKILHRRVQSSPHQAHTNFARFHGLFKFGLFIHVLSVSSPTLLQRHEFRRTKMPCITWIIFAVTSGDLSVIGMAALRGMISSAYTSTIRRSTLRTNSVPPQRVRDLPNHHSPSRTFSIFHRSQRALNCAEMRSLNPPGELTSAASTVNANSTASPTLRRYPAVPVAGRDCVG